MPAIALCVERAEKDVMKHPPRSKKEGLFSGIWQMMLVQCVWQVFIVVLTFVICYNTTGDNGIATTMAFLTLSLTELFYIVNIRSMHSIFTQNPFYNKLFWITMILSFAFDVVLISIPAVAGVLHFSTLSLTQWLISIGVALTIIPVIELFKLIKKIVSKNK